MNTEILNPIFFLLMIFSSIFGIFLLFSLRYFDNNVIFKFKSGTIDEKIIYILSLTILMVVADFSYKSNIYLFPIVVALGPTFCDLLIYFYRKFYKKEIL